MKGRCRVLIPMVVVSIPLVYAQPRPSDGVRLVGAPCEGCEAVFEFGDRTLTPVDTLPDYEVHEPKLMLTGTIYRPDGTTPAEGVVLYIYHTDRRGVYPTKGGEEGWARRHGYIRGWVRTGEDGRYTFYTFRPASYPNSTVPQHIHPTILEPGGKYYYINQYLFDDDPNLSVAERDIRQPRGGTSGIITVRSEDGMLVGTRDIILGKNIPGY